MPNRTQSQRGNAILEFAVVAPLLVVLLFGVFTTGMGISKSQQISSLTRQAGSMFMRLVDFANPGNQAMLIRQAKNLGLEPEGGSGVLVLSQLMKVSEADCRSAGLDPQSCPNLGFTVLVKRQFIGNRSLFQSSYGAPEGRLIDPSGTILAANYLTNSGCRAEQFESILSLAEGEIAYLSEGYFKTPELDIPGYKKDSSIYHKVVF